MNADLERAIALQRLDSAALEAHRRLAEEPEREKSFAARLNAANAHLAAARQRLSQNQDARRAIEKDVALQQGRLSKFRDQLMEVKTNREYQAMQHEIEIAQNEVRALEEKILERMLEADDLAAAVKAAEAKLASEQKGVDADRRALKAENVELTAFLEHSAVERATLVAAMDQQILAIFDLVARRRNGIAVAEARDGICTICHVRLRPQVFNTIRRNDEIVQCDSCQRILYFAPKTTAAAPDDISRAAQ
jgi:predicted  nucleic acid-binding Zn-ribbon protein